MPDPTITKTVIARSFIQRLLGLIGKTSLPEGEVWIFPRCRSIHTFFMRMPIDVVFLSSDRVVLSIKRAVPPWRMIQGPEGTHAVLEAAPGWLKATPGEELGPSK